MTKSPELLLSEAAQLSMMSAAARAHPDETGGILIGVYLDKRPWVTGASEILTDERGRNHYKIPAGATQGAVLTARARDQRLGYLGDWHSHPSDVGPSPTDLATLALISARHPRVPNPTQIVVRRSAHGYTLEARRFTTLTPRACIIRLTGGLPAPGRPPDPDGRERRRPNLLRYVTGEEMSNESNNNPIDLREIFAGHERSLDSLLKTGSNAGHYGVQGDGNEQHWIDLLNRHLPRRYAATRAFVVDSIGGRSEQLDLVIYDRQYSPEFWEHGQHHYLPAESVYAVLEIKPEFNREYVLYAAEKIASVRRLHRTSASFAWASGVHPGRKDFRPLGGILCITSGWTPAFGSPFSTALDDADTDGRLDLGCVVGHGAFEVPSPESPNQFRVIDTADALVGFLMTLLRRLQQLGTAPAIDYGAYENWIGYQSNASGSD